jgi:hypothetical protein
MESPAFFIRRRNEAMEAARPVFKGTSPMRPPSWSPLADALRHVDKDVRKPFLAVDGDSLASGSLGTEVMKNLRVRGADVWLLSYVEIAEDVFDAFNMGADMLLAPLHTIRSETALRDIHGVSDSVIPTLFCSGGDAAGMRGRVGIYDALSMLVDEGFPRCCILDTDGSVDWDAVREDFPSAIPFSNRHIEGFGLTFAACDPRGPRRCALWSQNKFHPLDNYPSLRS